jgi:hypothetical protein
MTLYVAHRLQGVPEFASPVRSAAECLNKYIRLKGENYPNIYSEGFMGKEGNRKVTERWKV